MIELHSRRAAGLVAAVVTVLAYGDVVFGGRSFLAVDEVPTAYGRPPFSSGYKGPLPARTELDPGAEIWQVVPWTYAERRALAEGTLPLWNRFAAFGTPLLSNGQTPLFNPVTALTLFSPGTPWLWNLQFLIWRFLAGYFCTLFLIELGARGPFVWMGTVFGCLFPSFAIFVSRADQGAFALVPMLLYLLLRLRASPGPLRAGFLALGIAFCLCAGHPEPSAAALMVAGLAALGFLAFPSAASALRSVGWMSIAALLGLSVSAPAWFPFFVSLKEKSNLHGDVIGTATRPAFAALEWLTPAAFSHARMADLFDVPWESFGFLGGALGLCVLIAVARLCLVRDFRRYAWALGGVFFSLRYFGAPGTGWTLTLPLVAQMLPFYVLPACWFSLGLAGLFAAAELAKLRVRQQALAIAAALTVALLVVLLARVYVPKTTPGGLSPSWGRQARVYVLLLTGLGASVWWWLRARGAIRWLPAALLVLVPAVELSWFRVALPLSGDAFAEPPYARFLQQRQAAEGPFYVTGLGYDFFPNTSTVWQLEDLRICDALFPPRYLTGLERLLHAPFNGTFFLHTSPPVSTLPRAALSFFGIRYLIGEEHLFAEPQPMAQALLAADLRLSAQTWPIEGLARSVVFQHPNDATEIEFTIPPSRPWLTFAITQAPQVWERPGGAVTYTLEANPGSGFVTLYQRTLNTRTQASDRRWRQEWIDLSRFAGRSTRFRFSAHADDASFGWGDGESSRSPALQMTAAGTHSCRGSGKTRKWVRRPSSKILQRGRAPIWWASPCGLPERAQRSIASKSSSARPTASPWWSPTFPTRPFARSATEGARRETPAKSQDSSIEATASSWTWTQPARRCWCSRRRSPAAGRPMSTAFPSRSFTPTTSSAVWWSRRATTTSRWNTGRRSGVGRSRSADLGWPQSS